ncbi:MAG: hypothetical protein ACRBN8_32930 [Nannocystales bacterium]
MRSLRWLVLGSLWLAGCRVEFVTGQLEAEGFETEPTQTSSTGSSTVAGSTSLETDGLSSESAAGETFLDTTGPRPECEAPKGHSICDTDDDPMHAIGLGCDSGPFDSTPVFEASLTSPDPAGFRVVRQFGNDAFVPREGVSLLVLSTGSLPEPDQSDVLLVPMGQAGEPGPGNGNPDGAALPAPILAESGTNGTPFQGCDGVGDCSDSLPAAFGEGPANDLVWLQFEVDVPPGTFGYRADIAWFSAEFPSKVGQPNDLFVWWQESESFTGNVAHLQDGTAMSATNLVETIIDRGIVGNNAALLGTGFEGTTPSECSVPGGTYANCPRGAGTDWLELDGSITPGERLQITVALFDLGSADIDTTVMVDNWRWNCDGCRTGDDCGIHPPL